MRKMILMAIAGFLVAQGHGEAGDHGGQWAGISHTVFQHAGAEGHLMHRAGPNAGADFFPENTGLGELTITVQSAHRDAA